MKQFFSVSVWKCFEYWFGLFSKISKLPNFSKIKCRYACFVNGCKRNPSCQLKLKTRCEFELIWACLCYDALDFSNRAIASSAEMLVLSRRC